MYSFHKATHQHIPALIKIGESWPLHEQFLGQPLDKSYFLNCILNGDLPPFAAATKENYTLYIVFYNQQPIGLFDIYFGYPSSRVAWISLFMVEQSYQGHGYGSTIIHKIIDDIIGSSYTSLELGVSTDNHNALHFWLHRGFHLHQSTATVFHLKKELHP